ncbi:Multidrug resistance protein [Lentibacillus sp. JNUCC-1]|uniref:MFS transporter n=1 Tax=Lentibacillus sp. JNUCC-1 TaxID=2654513 RepID=UPI0012E7047A|nr:MFS transporter [Lentibacillus sp. JNUCC-1]MUV38375.1 Multidrug resistance protein [Lentibacillus sp. JNUCC-1]
MDGYEPTENRLKLMSGILFWCALVVVSSAYVTTPLTGIFEQGFDVSSTRAVLPTSLFSLFYALGFLFFGPVSDRFGRKETLVAGFASLTIATLCTGMVSQFGTFLFWRSVQGFAAACFAPTALAYVFDVYPRRKIGGVVGLISFGYVASGIFGQVVAEWIGQTFDWHLVFYLFTIFYAASFIAIIALLPLAKRQVKHQQAVRHFLHGTKTVFQHRGLLKCYCITVLLLLIFIGMYTILGDMLVRAPFNLDDGAVMMVRAAGLIGMLCSLFAGKFITAFGKERILQSGLLLSVGGLLMLGLVNGVGLITLASIIYVAGMSLIFPAIMMMIGDFSGGVRGVANAWYAFILFAGATVGPMCAVGIAEITGPRLAVVLLGGVLAIALGIALTFKQYGDERKDGLHE